MPANRSRTERWRECLQQILERGGGLEFSVAQGDGVPTAGDLVWRVRILRLTDEEIIVERPSAAGQVFDLAGNVELVAVMSIGQNRWMFKTRTLGGDPRSRLGNAMRLAMPEDVERCRRRDFLRVSTASLNLPSVTCWPLLDPLSVVAAEVANRALIMDLESGAASASPKAEVLPEVAPPFPARLMNLGGGGVGLLVGPKESSSLDRSKLVWVRVDLTPMVPAPLGFTARVVHTHRDSEQNTYVGAAFEFGFHASHRDFVVSQITRYITLLQSAQRRAA